MKSDAEQRLGVAAAELGLVVSSDPRNGHPVILENKKARCAFYPYPKTDDREEAVEALLRVCEKIRKRKMITQDGSFPLPSLKTTLAKQEKINAAKPQRMF